MAGTTDNKEDIELGESTLQVERKTEAANIDDLDGEDLPEVEVVKPNSPSDKFLNGLAKLVVPYFIANILAVLAFWIMGFAVKEHDFLYGILVLHFVTGILGAWAIFKYGVIMDQIDKLKKQNKVYQSQIAGLKESRLALTDEVNKVKTAVGGLQQSSAELEEQVDSFKPLLDDLQSIAGDHEDILNMVESTNKVFEDMRSCMYQNERAALLDQFYDCALQDRDGTMNKYEWRDFLSMCTRETRAKFEEIGFERIAGDDGEIDLAEFQEVLEKILADVDAKLGAEMAKASDA